MVVIPRDLLVGVAALAHRNTRKYVTKDCVDRTYHISILILNAAQSGRLRGHPLLADQGQQPLVVIGVFVLNNNGSSNVQQERMRVRPTSRLDLIGCRNFHP